MINFFSKILYIYGLFDWSLFCCGLFRCCFFFCFCCLFFYCFFYFFCVLYNFLYFFFLCRSCNSFLSRWFLFRYFFNLRSRNLCCLIHGYFFCFFHMN
ncbi:hypothetical protein E5357_02055 [Hominisplanchenecus murintestinalis]|uniref:Uncharacterized protein n=1 Tax=Hominisplanchenecus murintestinalis TaxID=2941517 RepID=A0AC61R2M1_9FIRM|nr:hypothetical protein [Lachnospiraceae bacterium]NBI74325.1 hypothetical protein [Lachnospiraceae bacterium]RKJ97757.1 hypothetical protein D7Y41_06555 [Anaerotruncus sp. 1XD22-93]TGY00311.1 hypothetical protein E5357_02055 [Hominisplanchenecus murintestinalis]